MRKPKRPRFEQACETFGLLVSKTGRRSDGAHALISGGQNSLASEFDEAPSEIEGVTGLAAMTTRRDRLARPGMLVR